VRTHGFTLHQNYPNPFNPRTAIRYELPGSSHVTLAVYDVLGREVALLVNETQPAGAHVASFEATSLSSGVYFYRLHAGRFIDTKRLLLVR
jgi:glucuronoarabinoxylan endo-1,4-beta-xylanase